MSMNTGNVLSELYERIKRFASTRHGTFLMIYGPVLLGVPVALLLPENVLSSNSWLMSVADFLGQHFPMIVRLSEPTDFPQVAKLFYSFMLLLTPLWFGGLLLLPDERIVPLAHHIKHKIRSPLIYFVIAYAFLVTVQITPEESIDSLGGIMGLSRHSRLGLGLIGGLIMGGIVCWIYFIILWIKRIPKIYKFHN